jgi:hypothetical protein
LEHALPFSAWESFYVIVGSSAAALTGLQFVVITLGAERGVGNVHTTRAFGTPTVVHFSAVLLLSALLSAPWHHVAAASVALAVLAAAGIGYTLLVLRTARAQTAYKPVLEDWIFHTILPLCGYAVLLAGAALLPAHAVPSLFIVGGAALLLLFSGIHNGWDAVTYIAIQRRKNSDERAE